MIRGLVLGVILVTVAGCDRNTDRATTITELCGVKLTKGQAISDLSKVNLIEGWCRTQAIQAYESQVRAGLIERGFQPPDSLTTQKTECVQTQADVEKILQTKHNTSHLESDMCPEELKERIETYG